ncbi:MAG: addiction module antitoxin RelB [Cycloclasticus sp.]|nr:MAG: addiction module antitoxin RelB [Cycloclasticus sp.]
MYEVYESDKFSNWLKDLKDLRAKAKVIIRIERAKRGSFGDCEPVGKGISEMRIFEGKGYRVYFTKINGKIVWLLCGGDKSSQQKDIKQAIKMKELL